MLESNKRCGGLAQSILQPLNQHLNCSLDILNILCRKWVIPLHTKDVNYGDHEGLRLFEVVAKPNRIRFIKVQRSV